MSCVLNVSIARYVCSLPNQSVTVETAKPLLHMLPNESIFSALVFAPKPPSVSSYFCWFLCLLDCILWLRFFPFACPVMEIEGSDMWVHLLGSSDSEGFVIYRWCCLILSGIMMLAVVQGLNSSSCEEREERKGVEKGKKKKLITRIHLRRRCTVVCHSYLTSYIAWTKKVRINWKKKEFKKKNLNHWLKLKKLFVWGSLYFKKTFVIK